MGKNAHVLRMALGRNADQCPDWPSIVDQYEKLERSESEPFPIFIGVDPSNPTAFRQQFNEGGRPVDQAARDADMARCEAQNEVIQVALQTTCSEDRTKDEPAIPNGGDGNGIDSARG